MQVIPAHWVCIDPTTAHQFNKAYALLEFHNLAITPYRALAI